MKAKELMGGGWVRNIYGVKGWVFDIRYYKDGFGERYVIKLAYDDKGESYACPEMDLIEPIPLTPEILEKNGFKDMGFFGKLEIGPWRLICDSSNLAVLHEGREEEYINIPISYVHELQHALRLVGIEKEIEL